MQKFIIAFFGLVILAIGIIYLAIAVFALLGVVLINYGLDMAAELTESAFFTIIPNFVLAYLPENIENTEIIGDAARGIARPFLNPLRVLSAWSFFLGLCATVGGISNFVNKNSERKYIFFMDLVMAVLFFTAMFIAPMSFVFALCAFLAFSLCAFVARTRIWAA